MSDLHQRRHLDPSGRHTGRRNKLRTVGPIVLVAGFLTLGWGLFDIFVAGNMGFHFSPFVGMLMIFVGASTTMMGFAGALARYQANEIAPVAMDTFNDVADGTQQGVRTASRAFAGGLREGFTETADAIACPSCGHANEAGSKFCDQCGKPLSRACPSCGSANDADARFCDACGKPLV
ncbi:zinc ribbon domain-containing protein [Planctomycetales bacterium ZRK34]|nr:zinc ribbon domain-containing protein [Planctomycetales bacterium ZRK34]